MAIKSIQKKKIPENQKHFSAEGKFFVFCVEIYKAAKGLTGKDSYHILSEPQTMRFILDNFNRLHIIGQKQIVKEIDNAILFQSQLS